MLKLLERLLKDKVATEAITFKEGEAMPYLPDGTVVTADIIKSRLAAPCMCAIWTQAPAMPVTSRWERCPIPITTCTATASTSMPAPAMQIS